MLLRRFEHQRGKEKMADNAYIRLSGPIFYSLLGVKIKVQLRRSVFFSNQDVT